MNKTNYAGCLYVILVLSSLIIGFSAWVTHIIYCFSHGAWGFLIAGAMAFPIGVIHGIYLWF